MITIDGLSRAQSVVMTQVKRANHLPQNVGNAAINCSEITVKERLKRNNVNQLFERGYLPPLQSE